MGEESGDMDENVVRKFWGLRPWKRHSTILMVAGILYMLIGLQYIYGGPVAARDNSLTVILQFAPITVWGWLWVIAGLCALISSRWPPVSETWGYMLLTGLSAAWGATYLMGFLLYHPRTSLSGAIVFGLLAFMWWGISGLVNPDGTSVVSRGTE